MEILRVIFTHGRRVMSKLQVEQMLGCTESKQLIYSSLQSIVPNFSTPFTCLPSQKLLIRFFERLTTLWHLLTQSSCHTIHGLTTLFTVDIVLAIICSLNHTYCDFNSNAKIRQQVDENTLFHIQITSACQHSPNEFIPVYLKSILTEVSLKYLGFCASYLRRNFKSWTVLLTFILFHLFSYLIFTIQTKDHHCGIKPGGNFITQPAARTKRGRLF